VCFSREKRTRRVWGKLRLHTPDHLSNKVNTTTNNITTLLPRQHATHKNSCSCCLHFQWWPNCPSWPCPIKGALPRQLTWDSGEDSWTKMPFNVRVFSPSYKWPQHVERKSHFFFFSGETKMKKRERKRVEMESHRWVFQSKWCETVSLFTGELTDPVVSKFTKDGSHDAKWKIEKKKTIKTS